MGVVLLLAAVHPDGAGSGPWQQVTLVLRGTATRVGIGLGLGIPLPIGAGRLLREQLYGVTKWDPVALGVAAGALALGATAAAIPARRAASIPAVEALASRVNDGGEGAAIPLPTNRSRTGRERIVANQEPIHPSE